MKPRGEVKRVWAWLNKKTVTNLQVFAAIAVGLLLPIVPKHPTVEILGWFILAMLAALVVFIGWIVWAQRRRRRYAGAVLAVLYEAGEANKGLTSSEISKAAGVLPGWTDLVLSGWEDRRLVSSWQVEAPERPTGYRRLWSLSPTGRPWAARKLRRKDST